MREERLAILLDVIERYAVDGFELNLRSGSDTNFTAHFFHPSNVAAGRPLLTALVRKVREALRAKGEGLELVVRVPNLSHCEQQGLDLRGWCEMGLVDVIVGENADGNLCDTQVDFTPLVEVAAGTGVRVFGSVYSVRTPLSLLGLRLISPGLLCSVPELRPALGSSDLHDPWRRVQRVGPGRRRSAAQPVVL